ncbi:MAG: hypothetical protein EAX90_00740 [Candidatus Heimdallarchaeota archaeon]|nr:hypothetical protein [Candidatus Heimdallarchaeota archaeon]
MQKILFIGLDGAGKTAIYQKFFGKKPPAQLLNIPPTRGIAKYKHDFLRSDVEIIDVGGGKQYRQGYIGNTEIAKNLSAVVYIVDVQDVKNYQEAANYLILWTKSIADKLAGAKGYILFHKIDPGMEAQLKNGLAQLAQFIAPLDGIFPDGLIKTITSIYNDTSNQTIQRILLDTLPAKMSKPKPVPREPIVTTPTKTPVTQETYLTKPTEVKSPPSKSPVESVSPPIKKEIPKTTVVPPKVTPPAVSAPISTPPTSTSPVGISEPMKKEEANRIKEITAERLTDIIEASLDNNAEFEAIAVFTEQVECLVGAVQQGANPEIIKLIEATLHKINLEEYMSRLGKVRLGGEGHIKIGDYDIFFEKVSPEHLSTVICTSIQDDTIKNIAQLNRYLNQALSVTPEGVSEDTFKRADLMTELKMRLQNRGKSIDEML